MKKEARGTCIGFAFVLATFGALAPLAIAHSDEPKSATPKSTNHSMNVRYEDLKWEKIVPELGDKSSEITILRVDPETKAWIVSPAPGAARSG